MVQLKLPFEIPPGYKVAFVAWVTKNGKRIYAKTYGKKAFPILVKV